MYVCMCVKLNVIIRRYAKFESSYNTMKQVNIQTNQ